MSKKAQTAGDYLSNVFVLMFGTALILILIMNVIAPYIFTHRGEVIINGLAEQSDRNVFFTGYLAYPSGEKTIAELIGEAYLTKDFSAVNGNTSDIIARTFSDADGWVLFVEGKQVSQDCEVQNRITGYLSFSTTSPDTVNKVLNKQCRGKVQEYDTKIPLPYDKNKKTIDIKLRVYYNE